MKLESRITLLNKLKNACTIGRLMICKCGCRDCKIADSYEQAVDAYIANPKGVSICCKNEFSVTPILKCYKSVRLIVDEKVSFGRQG